MADTVVMELTDEVIAAAAAEVALETPGVYSLLPGITETIQGNILRRAVDAPGVKVSQDDHHVAIDMTLETEYGYNIPSVAWNVQERVKKRVEKIQDLTVDVVNIHVQKIHFTVPQEEADEQENWKGASHEAGL